MIFLIPENTCKIRALQLKMISTRRVAIALLVVVSSRINRLERVGRESPDPETSLIFKLEEWKTACILIE